MSYLEQKIFVVLEVKISLLAVPISLVNKLLASRLPRHMTAVLSIFMAIQLFVMTNLFINPLPFANNPAYGLAQNTTISTSADDHGRRFFGEGILQAIVYVPNLGNNNQVDNITLHITAFSDTGIGNTKSFQIPETNAGSSTFEFFLMHADASSVEPDDINPMNSDGVEGSTAAGIHASPIITFGPASLAADVPIDSELYEDAKFDVQVKDENISVNYEQSFARLALDRESYGSNNIVYVDIDDQDANLNPTARDSFGVDPALAPNKDLFRLEGGRILQPATFRETGDNTGVFEGEYRLGTAIEVNSESLNLAVFDKANYRNDLNSPENDSNLTDEISFSVGNTNGKVTINNNTAAGNSNDQQNANQTVNQVPTSDEEKNVGTKAITLSTPALKDEKGNVVYQIKKGSAATLSTSMMNNNDELQPFLAIIEARDVNGVTVFLGLNNSIVGPNGQAFTDALWIPDQEGEYQVRIFIISALANGEVLSSVSTSDVTIS